MSELPTHTGTDDVSAHPRHIGHRWFDITMAVCAIFISIISLIVAVEHGRTERDLVAASTWPFLRSDISNVFGEGRSIEIGISNGGVGPAKIRSYEMSFDGSPVGSPAELLLRCCGVSVGADETSKLLPNGSILTSLIDETVLRPGETNSVLIVSRATTDPVLFSKLDHALRRLSFHACYCSVLEQCWTTDLKSVRTQSVNSCAAPSHPYVYDAWSFHAPPR